MKNCHKMTRERSAAKILFVIRVEIAANAPISSFNHSRREEDFFALSYLVVRVQDCQNTSSIRSTKGYIFPSCAVATHAVIRDLTLASKERLHCRFELASHVRWSIRSACILEGRGESP